MNAEQQKTLLRIAKESVKGAVTGVKAELEAISDAALEERCGCFVTLKSGDDLRGCLGQFVSDVPVYELVWGMAAASATSDPRFYGRQIRPDELEGLNIEISVLSPLRKVDDPLSLRLGVDGIYVKKGMKTGCFLPQVATEAGWDEKEFLSYCCSHKAGLSPDAWRDGLTEVYLFTAEAFEGDYSEI